MIRYRRVFTLFSLSTLATLHASDSQDTDTPRSKSDPSIFDLKQIDNPIRTPNGEIIYELVGRFAENTSERHSLAYIIMPRGTSSLNHIHPTDEETYYILKGNAAMMLNGIISEVSQDDTIYIAPRTEHKITNNGNGDLVFLAVSAPAWRPEGSQFLERWKDGRAVPIEKDKKLRPKSE